MRGACYYRYYEVRICAHLCAQRTSSSVIVSTLRIGVRCEAFAHAVEDPLHPRSGCVGSS